MSTIITTAEPFAYHGSHKSRSYVTIGEPLRGSEQFGRVLYYSTHDGILRWVCTEEFCNMLEGDEDHDIWFDKDKRLECTRCGLVVQPEPGHAFGFTHTYDDRTGEIGYIVEPYFDLLHGPHGAKNREDAAARAERLIAVTQEKEGPGPWIVMPDENDGLRVRTSEISYGDEGWDECSGPFSDVRDARKALNERILARRFARTFQE